MSPARLMIALAAGALFGAGLLVSGMTDPARVRGWLDVFGAWDPTLAFVLGGAVLPMTLAWWAAGQFARQPVSPRASLTGAPLPHPGAGAVDARLIGGAALFGLGWGIAGYCPGPALASVGIGGAPVLVFVAAMAAGMIAARVVMRPKAQP
ncbi:MAG: hypothetical protein Q4G25_01155 [Paracoccus sp. (in: a-proteobacteria)]|nr:hypothetical protein [Paracoccus sp. (in: a-proteobacteria)]